MEKDTQSAVTACADSTAAIGVLLTDIVCMLAEHPGVDRSLLLDQLRGLYASTENSDNFQTVYNNYRARVVKGLEKEA
ncbi:MAG: hypothetical protein OEW15_04825 [Nitrospirota bacterium]|nr:hypothetical protein [Nitrospirota bacterium]